MNSFIYFFLLISIFTSFKSFTQENDYIDLASEANSEGPCDVEKKRIGNATYLIPSNPNNSNAKFNVLGWGNGSLMNVSAYSNVLSSIASHCILVAAANTPAAGNGANIKSAVEAARKHFPDLVQAKTKICTAGHSQGGGGAFNSANLLNANCVITVGADVSMTSHIKKPLTKSTRVIALWGSADAIAPANPSNLKTVSKNSTILTSVNVRGDAHFSIMSQTGEKMGTLFRMAAIAELSNNASQAKNFRAVFWGKENSSTVSEAYDGIKEVVRSIGAVNTNP